MFRKVLLWLSRLFQRKCLPVDPLPKGTKYLAQNIYQTYRPGFVPPRGVIVIEKLPQKRTILRSLKLDPECTARSSMFLQFPYTVFIIRFMEWFDGYGGKPGAGFAFEGVQVGFSMTPITSPTDFLYSLPLSNYEGDRYLSVCLGVASPRGIKFPTLNELVQAVISVYWQTEFAHIAAEDWLERDMSNLSPLMTRYTDLCCAVPMSQNTELINAQRNPTLPQPMPGM
jgi:hypothetical protein